jgi:Asp/Glu/hydantoin racemase
MVTCSSIGSAVEASAALTNVPVLRVDQAMADIAVQTGSKIGVIATLPTTLEPTSDLVRRRATAAGKQIELTSRLCEGAFDALMSGDTEKHDSMVAKALIELSTEVDVIVLAQASMARVVDTLPEADKRVPILASPGLAIQYIADLAKE